MPNLVLLERMELAGYTQSQLAARARLDKSTVNLIANGLRQPSRISAWKLAKALGCRPEDIGFAV